ncbi:hypothetical protein R1flu_024047 [Riccia fluitans]|uniref:Uncharacterized protein n=1 Tax=Riccia fluitans TaxID=41844 RepID=A0ABD1XU82_9MARC
MSRQEIEAIARSQKETATRLGQSSAGPSNHMESIDVHRGQPAASLQSLDAEDFDVDAFLGTNMGGCKEEMTPDFLDGLFVHDVRRLESEIENIRGEPQRVTRATARLRLNYEQDVLPPPTAEENVIDSTMVPTVGCSIDLTTDEAVDEPCSPADRQIISIVPSQRVDLTAVVSQEMNKCITTE